MPTRRACLFLSVCLTLVACSGEEAVSTRRSGLVLEEVLGGDDTSGYLRAEAARDFTFPADHGLHPGFRNEWWYLTGNLEDTDGRRYGYQVTFFTAALPPTADAVPDSAWYSERIWMAHVALTDVAAGTHRALERFSRENPGLAGARLEPFAVWLEDWRLSAGGGASDFPWRLQVADGAVTLDLELEPLKPPVLQGVDGLSQKSPESGNASYYYSLTRLATRGSLQSGSTQVAVSGSSWLDREWSTSALARGQSGWDWFSLQFDTGEELMYYQLRTDTGAAHPNSQGNWTSIEAAQTLVTPAEVELVELASWTSPAGVAYTTQWQFSYRGQQWQVHALLPDQWMNLSIPYWEGAVDVLDTAGTRVGRGYLEMVR